LAEGRFDWQAANQLHALVVTAPDQLRDQLRALPIDKLVALALTWRPGSAPSSLIATSKLAIRSLARRYRTLSEEIRDLDRSLTALINEVAPQLLAVKGLGPHTSAVLLIAVGDNPQRLRSESAFAHLCGAAPIPASSGKTIRYRLNRGGDRQANCALSILAVTRMAWDPTTKAYVARRTTEGKDQERNHPLPQAAHRPRDLQAPHRTPTTPRRRRLTPMRASGRSSASTAP
jgi:transposase